MLTGNCQMENAIALNSCISNTHKWKNVNKMVRHLLFQRVTHVTLPPSRSGDQLPDIKLQTCFPAAGSRFLSPLPFP